MYNLKNILNKRFLNSIFSKKSINIEFIDKHIYNIIKNSNKKITIDYIQKIVSKYYNIKLNVLLSKNKFKFIVIPKQIAIYLSKKLTNHTLCEISNKFGYKNHTIILYTCKKIECVLSKNINYSKDVFNLIKLLL